MTEPKSGRRGPRITLTHTGRRTSKKDALKAGIKVERTNQKAKPCISVVRIECPGELSISCPCHSGQGGASMRGHWGDRMVLYFDPAVDITLYSH